MAIGCQIASPCLVLVITARFVRVRRSETRHGLCLPLPALHIKTISITMPRSRGLCGVLTLYQRYSFPLAVPKISFPFGCTEANGSVGFIVACSVACLAACLFSVWLGSYSVGYLVTSFALWLVSTCLVG